MAAAHVCPCCGTDLARVRALRDAVYGLPIVVCGACGSAWVRRRHPIVAQWRCLSRVAAAVATLLSQLVLIAAGTVAIATMIVITEHNLRAAGSGFLGVPRALLSAAPGTRIGDWMHAEGRFFLLLLVVSSFLAGGWLIATLGHWRVARLLAAWWALMSLLLSIEMIGFAWDLLLCWFGGAAPHPQLQVDEWAQRLVGAAACTLNAAAAAPIAIPLRRLGPRLAARGRAKRRARIRKQRAGA